MSVLDMIMIVFEKISPCVLCLHDLKRRYLKFKNTKRYQIYNEDKKENHDVVKDRGQKNNQILKKDL